MHRLAVPLTLVTLFAAIPSTAVAIAPPSFAYATKTVCAAPHPNAAGDVVQSFGGPGETPTNAVLVVPQHGAKHAPAVLWVHWLGEPATTNHTEFAGDARALAEHSVVSLLVDMPWSKKDWFTAGRTPATDYADTIAQVVTLRRALDCLIAIPGVDANRIALVGHDFGAMTGALLLAVDPRPSYAVLMTPTLSFWEWYLLGPQPTNTAAYVDQMSAFDLPAWLAQGKQKATLLQFAKNDEYVAQATGIAFRSAVPNRDRTLKRYENLDHGLDREDAHDDRRSWLVAHLGF